MEVRDWTPESLRAFEGEIKEIYSTGVIRGPVHLSGGNEDQLIEIFKQVEPDDWVFSTYRSHYHALLKGIPRERVKAEIVAGRSSHLNFADYNFFTSALVGGTLPIALGVALGIKLKGEKRIVWAFIGDMTWETGICHECVKYAKNHNLPLCVVVEDNGFSTNTPTQKVWGLPDITGAGRGIEPVLSWEKGGVLRYFYNRIHPHLGIGVWVRFRETEKKEERTDVMA